MTNKIKTGEFSNILLEYGFKKTNIPNEYKNHNYTAVVSKGLGGESVVYLTTYTPNTKRFLDSFSYTSLMELDKRLKNIFGN
ncbi:MAG: hypothetical protein RLZ10_749 [Bacteroidota bacterium]|jgi:hypothetical protein